MYISRHAITIYTGKNNNSNSINEKIIIETVLKKSMFYDAR